MGRSQGDKGQKDSPGYQERAECHRRIIYLRILVAAMLMHVAAWRSRGFCDWYREHIFGIWVNTYGRAVGMIPFSVGEVLIALALVLALVLVLSALAWLAVLRVERLEESREILGRFCRWCGRISAWVLLGAFVLMTLNCYILYHGSGFSGEYLITDERDYTLEDLASLRDFVVGRCNALGSQMQRGEDGTIFYEGDMIETAKVAMRHLGETYEGLSGFYPSPKPLYSSDFMSQQYVAGCFFPFSMEANYNNVMYVMNLPSTICHELGHLKGFILEDEANLISYLACIQSEDLLFRYSGYLSVLYYIENDFQQAVGNGGTGHQSETEAAEQEETLCQKQILSQVHADNIFLTNEERSRIEREALLDTETVDAVSDSIADASLKLNGVEEGMMSYSRVVELLLRYYDIYGYPQEDP